MPKNTKTPQKTHQHWGRTPFLRPLVCLDLETTGSNPVRDRIIEVGLWRYETDGEVSHYTQLLQPGVYLPPGITALTGIRAQDLEEAPNFEDIADTLSSYLDNAIIAAHNARFDLGFLRQAFKRLDRTLSNPVLCTVKLSRALHPGIKGHSLDAVIARHNLACERRHRASDDARIVGEFIMLMAKQHPERLKEACEQQWARPSLPPALPADALDELPESHGVYLFYGENDLPLYIGKANNLKRRVFDHFRSDHRAPREMRLSQQTQRIDWRETAGEMGALLLEAQLIKEHSPILNRRLRRSRELVTLFWEHGGGQVPQVLRGESPVGEHRWGAFRSVRDAKNVLRSMAQEQGLCLQRLGLEKGRGTCFGAQLGRCRGVCCGRETPAQHDLRLATALQKLRIARWPYPGPIAIKETNGAKTALHVVDQWAYLGSVSDETDWDDLLSTQEVDFDLDIYRLLLKALQGGFGGLEIFQRIDPLGYDPNLSAGVVPQT
ncbi:DNA polymerase-3 subunit epsilon [Ectothiorhodosinus mongolicus]|uniref:Excinuclease cho n=1 Tax=Ectothiorhodosinus mongolicus TaxID=233100 RepID=A0A1R3VMC6_9GAMM|nr:exonuclease domain-containing protein [Ectothiorhodosinus mongolicus]ULX57835.1 DNA polymerase III subunit epsilon [Ectothiorhodosinus mongolicus]SIT65707.1 DNA polymerase-3 subunit epsilon [Ectothiorhodosinus mongolicus]